MAPMKLVPHTMCVAHVCGFAHTTSVPQTMCDSQTAELPHVFVSPHSASLVAMDVPHTMWVPHTMCSDQTKSSPPMLDEGATLVVHHEDPTGAAVLVARARSSAPAALSAPAPCVSWS